MRIKELAQRIAEDFNKAVVDADCENFKEMKRLYDWEASDIRSEIEYMIKDMENNHDSGIGVLDDGTICNFRDMKDPDDECTYGAFKKMVFKSVK